jgi:hypothetical protein
MLITSSVTWEKLAVATCAVPCALASDQKFAPVEAKAAIE